MGKLTAEERRRAFELRQARAWLTKRRPGRVRTTAGLRTARWAIVGIMGRALSMMAASEVARVVPPLELNTSASLVEWLVPRTE